MVRENRDFGSAPFKEEDIDLSEFKRGLAQQRKIDEAILLKISLAPNDIPSLTMDHAIEVLNSLLLLTVFERQLVAEDVLVGELYLLLLDHIVEALTFLLVLGEESLKVDSPHFLSFQGLLRADA